MTEVVTLATDDGTSTVRPLIADPVDSYEVETPGFLQKESENIAALIERVREAAPRGKGGRADHVQARESRAQLGQRRAADPDQREGPRHRPPAEPDVPTISGASALT